MAVVVAAEGPIPQLALMNPTTLQMAQGEAREYGLASLRAHGGRFERGLVEAAEIEQVLLSHPQNLVLDVAVAGVPAASSRDDRVPRAWVVLSPAGLALGTSEVTRLRGNRFCWCCHI